jgi:hypothetical protein
MTETAEQAPTVLLGRCVNCKRAFRVEVPAGTPVYPSAPGFAIRMAGLEEPSCDCRATTRCPEMANGLPECLDWDCAGHPQTTVKFKAVKVTYKLETPCGGGCWGARSSNCLWSCRGKNHGGMWAIR